MDRLQFDIAGRSAFVVIALLIEPKVFLDE